MQQAEDFRAESQALYDLIKHLSDDDYATPTQFKQWTFNDILLHLHFFNRMALFALIESKRFAADYASFDKHRSEVGMVAGTARMMPGLTGSKLLRAWRQYVDVLAPEFAAADPKSRVKWVGPDMSVRSSITARLMETWSHGQAIYDQLGVRRHDHDRIRNIAHLGVSTFAWTFVNRDLPVPGVVPYVRLIAPSGDVWDWGDINGSDRIDGSATEFCQVVCQTRNIADTNLSVKGPVAQSWMASAQCFAGPPNPPPIAGSRKIVA